ncbi:putative class III homeodomain-leucine zipper family [Helianthus annuus]|nr:putative class III homeodomain-leucine zipper family [Helianthus annuus]
MQTPRCCFTMYLQLCWSGFYESIDQNGPILMLMLGVREVCYILAALVKASPYGYQGTWPTRFTGSQIIMPLGLTIEHEEMLEVIRLEGHAVGQEDPFVSRDIHLLQMLNQLLLNSLKLDKLCSGIDENAVGRVLDKYFLSPNPKHRESYISLLLLFSVASAKSFSRPKCKQDIHPIGIIWDLVMLCQEVR